MFSFKVVFTLLLLAICGSTGLTQIDVEPNLRTDSTISELVLEISTDSVSPSGIELTSDGDILVFASDRRYGSIRTNSIYAWSVLSQELLGTFEVEDDIDKLTLTFNGRYAIVSTIEQLYVWSLESFRVTVLDLDGQDIVDVRVSPTNDFFALVTSDNGIFGPTDIVIVPLPLDKLTTVEGGDVGGISISPDGNTIVSSTGYNNTISIWTRTETQLSMQAVYTIEGVSELGFLNIEFACDGLSIVADDVVSLWNIDLETGNAKELGNGIQGFYEGGCSDTHPILLENGRITFLNATTGISSYQWEYDEFGIYRALSNNESFAIGIQNDSVNLWNLSLKEMVTSFEHPNVVDARFNVANDYIVTWSYDGLIRVWPFMFTP